MALGLAQRLAPGQVVGFLAQIHPAHPDGGLGFPELRLKAAVVAHGGSQRHEGALIGKAGVHGIKAHERLPGGDHVVVVHIHGDDLAAHLRHDAQHIAGDIGVVRAFLKTQKQIPPRARAYPREQEQQKQDADDRALAGAFAPLRSLVVVRGHGKIFVCRHERLPRGAWFPELPLFSHVMGEIELTGQFYTTPAHRQSVFGARGAVPRRVRLRGRWRGVFVAGWRGTLRPVRSHGLGHVSRGLSGCSCAALCAASRRVRGAVARPVPAYG